jgi:GDP-fucose protein O-fucosyltransferase
LVEKNIAKNIKKNKPNQELPIVVMQKESLGGWIRSQDHLNFQLSYRSIFRFSKPLVAMGQRFLTKLPYVSFFGVHLRLESDWLVTTDEVMGQFLDLILAHNTTDYPIVYVACGDRTKLDNFTDLAKTRGVLVEHKWTLMDETDAAWAANLHFDQIGIIDRVVLEKATYFFGVGGSSFSFSAGMARHVAQFGNLEYHAVDDEKQYLLGEEGVIWNDIMW